MDVQFVGIKAQTINKEGGRERRYDVVGFEEVTYIASFKVKTGDEELVDPQMALGVKIFLLTH